MSDVEKTWIYIGSTCKDDITEREKEHKDKPVNKLMREVVDKPGVTITLIKDVPCLSSKDLLKYEDEYIEMYRQQGYNVINVKCNIKNKKAKDIKEIEIKQDKHYKFEIKDNEKEAAYMINYTDEDGKYVKKKFRYKKVGKQTALAAAEAFREELITKFY